MDTVPLILSRLEYVKMLLGPFSPSRAILISGLEAYTMFLTLVDMLRPSLEETDEAYIFVDGV